MKKFIMGIMVILTCIPVFTSCSGFSKNTQDIINKVTPKDIKEFRVKSRKTKSVTLTWSSSKNATDYKIFRSEEKSEGVLGKYVKCVTISGSKTTSFTDKNLISGKLYSYKIYAYHRDEKYTSNSRPVVTKVMTKMPCAKKLKVVKASSKSIELNWNDIQGAREYIVYRKTSDSKYIRIGKTDVSSYKDEKITSGTTYEYKVVGCRNLGKKVFRSKGRSIKVDSGVTAVKGVTVKTYLNRALLTWDSVSGASGYDVFCKNSKGKFKLVESRKYCTFLSKKGESGKSYRYAIKAYNLLKGKKNYSDAKYVTVTLSDKAFGKKPGKTYIEICTETQHMYMYVNNKLYCDTPVVTGMYNSQDTHHGFHKVISRKAPARLRGSANGHSWDVMVKYWLGFTYDGQGVHDSSWRYSGYGNEIYKGDGSNGCVNTPLDKVSKIYEKGYYGMPVIVY
ncbi:MAG: fibronectin type III domain-containing protein [Ruminococcus sp.]